MRREATNPSLRVKRFRERRRERLLTDGEVSAIYTALEASEATGFEHWSTILAIRLLFATACRASEIRGLRWHPAGQPEGDRIAEALRREWQEPVPRYADRTIAANRRLQCAT